MEGKGRFGDKEEIFFMLAAKLREAFLHKSWQFERLQEIRLRVNCPATVVYGGRSFAWKGMAAWGRDGSGA